MAALTVQTISDAGTTVTFAASGASDTARIGSGYNTFVIMRNTTGAPVNFTIAVPGNTFFGTATADNVISVPATTGVKYVPLRKEYDDGTGNATITVTPAAGVEIAVVKVA